MTPIGTRRAAAPRPERLAALAGTAVTVLVACSGGGSPGSAGVARQVPAISWQARAAHDDPVVARVDDAPITASDVQRAARIWGASPSATLEKLVGFELLAAQARRDGQALGDADDDHLRAAMVRRYLESEVEPHLGPADIPEAELRARYAEAREHFVHTRLVEAQFLMIPTRRLKDEAQRQLAERTAREVAAHVAAHPELNVDQFSALYERPEWRAAKLLTFRRFQSAPGPSSQPFSSVVASAVHALGAPGQTTGLVQDDTGYYIARYVSERAARHDEFETARAELVSKYHDHWRKKRFLELTDQLGRKFRAQASPELLSDTDRAAP